MKNVAIGSRRQLICIAVLLMLGVSARAASITSFAPTNSYRGYEALYIIITGTDFTGTTNVLMNGNPVQYFNVDSDTSIRFQVPITYSAEQLTGLITVQNPGGDATSTNNFQVTTTPDLSTGFYIRDLEGYKLVLDGYALGAVTSVNFKGSASFTVASDWRLLVPIDSIPTSNVTASVTAPAGTAQVAVVNTVLGLINGIPPGTAGQFDMIGFDADGSSQNSSATYVGSDNWVRVAADFIYLYSRYVDIGTGTVYPLSSTSLSTITQTNTLSAANQVTSAGTFTGSGANTIAWTNVSSLNPYSGYFTMTATFTAQSGTLGILKLRPYLDEDVDSTPGNDLFATNGTVVAEDLLLLLLDNPRRFGFGMDGTYAATADKLVNATFNGFGAARFSTLKSQITGRTQVYGSNINAGAGAGYNVNTNSLVVSNDVDFGTIYIGDVSASLSWTADSNATTATITTRLVNRFASGPCMYVLGTNSAIVSSSEAASAAKGTDFGTVQAGQAPVTNTFAITNVGTASLTISGCVTSGTDAASFTVAGLPASVAQGSASSFTIAFDPAATGTLTASVEIANDSAQNPYVVNLCGTAPTNTGTADIAVSDFVYLPVNATNLSHAGTVSCRLANNGPDALTASGVAFDFYMGTSTANMVLIGSAQNNYTLTADAEELVILTPAAKRGLVVRADLSGIQTVKVTVRHLSTLNDPNLTNNTTFAAGTVRIKTSGANSIGRSFNDYDGDGKADGAVYRDTDGRWYAALSGYRYQVWLAAEAGLSGLTPVPGDYDGDGITDMATYNRLNGWWTAQLSSTEQMISDQFGGPEYTPVPCDFDGDGKTDPVVYHDADGYWYAASSAEGYALKEVPGCWPGYSPVPGDYDGDGLADPAAYYNGRTGEWVIGPSSMGYLLLTGVFGGPGWIAASADYDGDGKTDPAVYNSDTATWQVLLSGSLDATGQYTWWEGVAGSVGGLPAPADYDGDGKADLAVYHLDTGIWQLFLSTSGYQEISGGFGGPAYQPAKE